MRVTDITDGEVKIVRLNPSALVGVNSCHLPHYFMFLETVVLPLLSSVLLKESLCYLCCDGWRGEGREAVVV